MTIAHISPSKDAVSETFIQRHRDTFKNKVISYYGPIFPNSNNIDGNFQRSKFKYFWFKVKSIFINSLSINEMFLQQSFKLRNIKVCYVEYGTCAIKVMRICQYLDIPLVVNFHGYDAHETNVVEQNKIKYQQLFLCCHSVVSVSQYMTNSLIKLGCPVDKIRKLPCFPDTVFGSVKPNYYGNKLLAVGRFVDKKAPYLTLLAFALAQKKCPNIELNFVGDGPLLNSCINLTRALHINNVNFLGAIPHDEVLELFSDSFMFLQHSIRAKNGDCEGTPVSVMEACLSGLVVISTLHAGIPDVVIHDKMGKLVEECDVDAMAEAMISLINERKNCEKIGTFAKEHMKIHYSAEIYANELNAIIDDALKVSVI